MTGQQLKNSILQMAVQGKLVPQDPNDEPASVLLERIRAEKEALIKAGKIKKEKNPSVIFRGADNLPYENDTPFEIPDSWEWIRHNDIFEISGGSQPPKSKFRNEKLENYIRLYQIRDYGENPVPVYIPISTASKRTKKGDILLARYGASLGKVFWAEDGAYNVAMAKVIPIYSCVNEIIDKEYLFYYYHTDLYRSVIFNNSRSAQAGFNKEDLDNMWFPLPPKEEQRRIVLALNNVLPHIEKYSDAERKLHGYNKEFPEKLKKSILQEAVQGKLVPQDPNDEPASVLLERIRAEKQRLIKEGKIKKDKHESVIFRRDNSHYEKLDGIERCIDDEIPFEIPDNWCWTRLGNIGETNIGLTYKPSDKVSEEDGIAVLRSNNIQKSKMNYNDLVYVSCDVPNRAMIDKGDILICARNGSRALVGKAAIVDMDGMAFGAFMAKYTSILSGSLNPYILLFIESPVFRKQLDGVKTETINQITQDMLKSQLIPIPPLSEQHRIVEKHRELLDKITLI